MTGQWVLIVILIAYLIILLARSYLADDLVTIE